MLRAIDIDRDGGSLLRIGQKFMLKPQCRHPMWQHSTEGVHAEEEHSLDGARAATMQRRTVWFRWEPSSPAAARAPPARRSQQDHEPCSEQAMLTQCRACVTALKSDKKHVSDGEW
jgi:hypothetical protein